MTEEQLKAIEERAEKATDGPWVAMHYGTEAARYPGWHVDCNPPDVLPVAVVHHGYGGEGEREANARFIAGARTDVPALCAFVRNLQLGLSEARMWLSRFQTDHEAYALGREVGQHEEQEQHRLLLIECRNALLRCCDSMQPGHAVQSPSSDLVDRLNAITGEAEP